MNSSDAWVFWILIPLFAAVGLYLLWYTHRRKRMMTAFARHHGLRVDDGPGDGVQRLLDRQFRIAGQGMTRGFSRIRSVVDDGDVQLFRATELLDLNPYGEAASSHHGRIAALFGADGAPDGFFLLHTSGECVSRIPAATPDDVLVARCRAAARDCGVRHTLSLTFAGAKCLAYLEPRVIGGESPADVEALYCLSRRLRRALARPVPPAR